MVSEKLLGVIVDIDKTWKPHIDKLAQTISRNIALLRHTDSFLVASSILYSVHMVTYGSAALRG